MALGGKLVRIRDIGSELFLAIDISLRFLIRVLLMCFNTARTETHGTFWNLKFCSITRFTVCGV